eukprot:1881160-Pyramimonas_sp.AAC.1
MAEPAGYEHKMAAIVERIKAKEKVKRDQDDDNNTILGRTRHAVPEVAEPQQGGSGCTGTRTPAESLAPTEPAVPQWRHGDEVPPVAQHGGEPLPPSDEDGVGADDGARCRHIGKEAGAGPQPSEGGGKEAGAGPQPPDKDSELAMGRVGKGAGAGPQPS